MLVSDIKRRVKRQFGDESGAQLKDADIIDFINDAQREIYNKNNLGETIGTVATIVGTQSYSFPAGLMRLFSVKYDGISLTELAQQDADNYLPNNDALASTLEKGSPTHYWTYADKIFLYPIPDSVKNLTIRYNRYPTDVAADGDTTDLDRRYDNRILDYCYASAYQLDGNMQSYTLWMQRFEGKVNQNIEDEFELQAAASYPGISVSLRDGDEGNYC
jgi:uncharacterized protein DUF6682